MGLGEKDVANKDVLHTRKQIEKATLQLLFIRTSNIEQELQSVEGSDCPSIFLVSRPTIESRPIHSNADSDILVISSNLGKSSYVALSFCHDGGNMHWHLCEHQVGSGQFVQQGDRVVIGGA